MVPALLFIIAGILFCFTIVGAPIGITFIAIGFIIMLVTGAKSMGRWGAIVLIGFLALVYFHSAHAASISSSVPVMHSMMSASYDQRLLSPMMPMHSCMTQVVATEHALKKHPHYGTPVQLLNHCLPESDSFFEACKRLNYDDQACSDAVMSDAKAVLDAVTIADGMAP